MSSVPATGAVMDLHLPDWTGLVGSTGVTGVDGSTGFAGSTGVVVGTVVHLHATTLS